MKKQYYSMEKTENEANINIYGDITSAAGKTDFWGEEIDGVSASTLSEQIKQLGDVSRINVYINSYGGEVAEGLAIYNALKRHKAKVITYCDGFACSIASVIFMAGDERIMNESSLLMIHNAWSWGEGNADQLRKQADDLDKITQASVNAYKSHSTLSEEEIKDLMDKETWILPDEALEYGFATSIEQTEHKAASQNAKNLLFEIIKQYRQEADTQEEGTDEENDEEAENPATDGEDDEGEEKPADDEETPADGENEDETGEENEQQNAEQKFSRFFNAILNM